MKDLPPPVTHKSSKKDMWEEIMALRDEVNDLMNELRHKKDSQPTVDSLENHINALEWQLSIVRQTLTNKIVRK